MGKSKKKTGKSKKAQNVQEVFYTIFDVSTSVFRSLEEDNSFILSYDKEVLSELLNNIEKSIEDLYEIDFNNEVGLFKVTVEQIGSVKKKVTESYLIKENE